MLEVHLQTADHSIGNYQEPYNRSLAAAPPGLCRDESSPYAGSSKDHETKSRHVFWYRAYTWTPKVRSTMAQNLLKSARQAIVVNTFGAQVGWSLEDFRKRLHKIGGCVGVITKPDRYLVPGSTQNDGTVAHGSLSWVWARTTGPWHGTNIRDFSYARSAGS